MASSGFSLIASSGFRLVALFKSEQEQRNVKTRKMATIILGISPPFVRLHCYHNYLGKNINDNELKSTIFAEVNDLLLFRKE
jgi:heme/copper-type cytochrome/quinol oxidase subunit 3